MRVVDRRWSDTAVLHLLPASAGRSRRRFGRLSCSDGCARISLRGLRSPSQGCSTSLHGEYPSAPISSSNLAPECARSVARLCHHSASLQLLTCAVCLRSCGHAMRGLLHWHARAHGYCTYWWDLCQAGAAHSRLCGGRRLLTEPPSDGVQQRCRVAAHAARHVRVRQRRPVQHSAVIPAAPDGPSLPCSDQPSVWPLFWAVSFLLRRTKPLPVCSAIVSFLLPLPPPAARSSRAHQCFSGCCELVVRQWRYGRVTVRYFMRYC